MCMQQISATGNHPSLAVASTSSFIEQQQRICQLCHQQHHTNRSASSPQQNPLRIAKGQTPLIIQSKKHAKIEHATAPFSVGWIHCGVFVKNSRLVHDAGSGILMLLWLAVLLVVVWRTYNQPHHQTLQLPKESHQQDNLLSIGIQNVRVSFPVLKNCSFPFRNPSPCPVFPSPPASHRCPWHRISAPFPALLPNLPSLPFSLFRRPKPSHPSLAPLPFSPSIEFPLFFPPSEPPSSASGPLLVAGSGVARDSYHCDAVGAPPQVELASFAAPSLPSTSAGVPSESGSLPSPSGLMLSTRTASPQGVDVVVEYPWKPGQGESIPAPQRQKTQRKSPSKPKPSGRFPPPALAGLPQKGLSPKAVATTTEVGIKTASTVHTSNAFAALQNLEVSILPEEPQGFPLPKSDSRNAFAALQNPEDSILPEEPQGFPPPDTDSSISDKNYPDCDPSIPDEVKLVEIHPGPSSTNISTATRSSRTAKRVLIEVPLVPMEKDVGPPSGVPMFHFVSKLRILKGKMKELNRNLGNVHEEVACARASLEDF
ncbi:hypothetical protein Nepgr_005318 [Nepenthes gracilis]|uniref:Uncharacterized protein n=1 Tax=Nepenthes gracilis TaxID=150966 RepID=A0AAD3XG67_NEPGR|nr:hypothetical protein Nepgr_005318 [Nepenthes gracilis]